MLHKQTTRAGSVSGAVCIWQAAGEWQHIKAMAGHSGVVNDVAVHPSGSVALSVSRDAQMRLWDLTKGSCAYQAPLGGEGTVVAFLQGGARYAIGAGAKATLHSVKVRPCARARLLHGANSGSRWLKAHLCARLRSNVHHGLH